jgi:chaperonin GroEL
VPAVCSGAGLVILSKLKADNDDQRLGIEIVRKAIQTPLRQTAGKDGAALKPALYRNRPC